MRNIQLEILGYMCYMFGVTILIAEIIYIKKIKSIHAITVIRLFYAIIYGFAPGAIYTYVFKHGSTDGNLRYIDFSNTGIGYLWTGYFLSIITFVIICIAYHSKRKRIRFPVLKTVAFGYKGLFVSASILMFVGLVSLLLWTKVYGGPIGILPYANALRAGRDIGIYNPFSFFMRLCPFSMFASYIFWLLYLNSRRISNLILFVVSGITTFLYLLACSSRMMFALFFIILIFIRERVIKEKKNRKLNIVIYILTAFIGLLIMNAGESIMNVFQLGEYNDSTVSFSFDVFKILRNEFFFPSESIQVVLNARENNLVGYRIFVDLISGILSWLPSRFRPDSIQRLEIIHTELKMGTMIYGGLPTDLVTTCLYEMGYLGIIVIPFFYGKIIKKMDKFYEKRKDSLYCCMVYILGCFYLMKIVAYADFSNIMSNIFYLVFGCLCVRIVCSIYKSKENF